MGERGMPKQEICHRMMSESFIYRSHSCRQVNLRNDRSMVVGNTNTIPRENESDSRQQIDIVKTIIEMYGERTKLSNWLKDTEYDEARKTNRAGLLLQKQLEDLTIDEFCSVYTSGKQGSHRNKIKKAKADSFVRFKPRLQSDQNLPTYPEYCRLNLIRYKMWNGNISNAYGGQESTEDDWKRLWKEHIECLAANNEDPPDYAIRELQRLTNLRSPVENDLVGEDGMAEGDDIGEEINVSNFGLVDGVKDIDDDDFEFADFSNLLVDHEPIHDLSEAGSFEAIRKKKVEIIAANVNSNQRAIKEVDPATLNTEQQQFYKLMETMLRYYDNDSNIKSVTDGGEGFHRGVVLKGRGGTGKSTVLNAVRSNLLQSHDQAIITATTGKAATMIGGSTIYSAQHGLAIPVSDKPYVPLQGNVLRDLQNLFRPVVVLFIDEYSMLPQHSLYHIDKRLREVKVKNCPFGGLIVVLVGDLAQLPPVGAVPVWCERDKVGSKKKDEKTMNGLKLWKEHFKTVIELKQNVRIKADDVNAVAFNDFLENLANGAISRRNWENVRDTCSRDTIGDVEWDRRGFNQPSTTYLFTTNREVLKKNHEQLRALQKPILKAMSYNSTKSAKAQRADFFQGLPNRVFLSESSKVLLTTNLKPELGLANGSTGIVKAFVWEDGATNEDLSDVRKMFVWVDFGDQYIGDSFFRSMPERNGWFPIFPFMLNLPQKKQLASTGSDSRTTTMLSRMMLPLKLAWSWTVHKAQGQTLEGLVVLTLGDDEYTSGLSYTAFSRAQRFANVGVNGGIPKNRITTLITGKDTFQRRLDADTKLSQNAQEILRTLRLPTTNNI